MKPHYKDEPREWRRFMLQFCTVGLVIALIFRWRGTVTTAQLAPLVALLSVLALAALVRPGWFRAFHRVSMTASAWLGERMGKVVLTLLFLLVFTPLGLALRLFRYDPLGLRRTSGTGSYWSPVKRRNRLDRLH